MSGFEGFLPTEDEIKAFPLIYVLNQYVIRCLKLENTNVYQFSIDMVTLYKICHQAMCIKRWDNIKSWDQFTWEDGVKEGAEDLYETGFCEKCKRPIPAISKVLEKYLFNIKDLYYAYIQNSPCSEIKNMGVPQFEKLLMSNKFKYLIYIDNFSAIQNYIKSAKSLSRLEEKLSKNICSEISFLRSNTVTINHIQQPVSNNQHRQFRSLTNHALNMVEYGRNSISKQFHTRSQRNSSFMTTIKHFPSLSADQSLTENQNPNTSLQTKSLEMPTYSQEQVKLRIIEDVAYNIYNEDIPHLLRSLLNEVSIFETYFEEMMVDTWTSKTNETNDVDAAVHEFNGLRRAKNHTLKSHTKRTENARSVLELMKNESPQETWYRTTAVHSAPKKTDTESSQDINYILWSDDTEMVEGENLPCKQTLKPDNDGDSLQKKKPLIYNGAITICSRPSTKTQRQYRENVEWYLKEYCFHNWLNFSNQAKGNFIYYRMAKYRAMLPPERPVTFNEVLEKINTHSKVGRSETDCYANNLVWNTFGFDAKYLSGDFIARRQYREERKKRRVMKRQMKKSRKKIGRKNVL